MAIVPVYPASTGPSIIANMYKKKPNKSNNWEISISNGIIITDNKLISQHAYGNNPINKNIYYVKKVTNPNIIEVTWGEEVPYPILDNFGILSSSIKLFNYLPISVYSS